MHIPDLTNHVLSIWFGFIKPLVTGDGFERWFYEPLKILLILKFVELWATSRHVMQFIKIYRRITTSFKGNLLKVAAILLKNCKCKLFERIAVEKKNWFRHQLKKPFSQIDRNDLQINTAPDISLSNCSVNAIS